MKTIKYLLVAFALIPTTEVWSQGLFQLFRKAPINMLVVKQGFYVGIEKGVMEQFEIGSDYQRKRIKGESVKIHGITNGFSYSIKDNIAGYSLGYYRKKGSLGLSYGIEAYGITDFKKIIPAVSPLIGFKFVGLHFQSGYKVFYPGWTDIPANTFFVRLRFTINQQTEWKLLKNKK